MSSDPGVRPTGRPRDPRCDGAILAATLELLADGGYAAATVEAVAARAGVGKATVYRRYAGKDELVVDALATLVEPAERLPRGSVRDECVGLLNGMRRSATASLAGRILPRLLSEAVDNPALMARYREQVVGPRRARLATVLRRGMDEGLLRPDLDVEHAMDLLIGPMVYRNLLVEGGAPAGSAARVVDDVLAGLAAR